ncbi:MAG: hypothetical protein JW804_03995 [Sedimentisphaerales bacterium]|nr:hypothetical protein [Sedimentisphaerales bacterium]
MNKKIDLTIKVILHYLIAAVSVFINIALAYCTAKFLITKHSKPINSYTTALLVLGTCLILIAGIGKLGWSIQTIGGNSIFEKLNNGLFWCLSHLGTFLIFLSIFISLVKNE